MASVFDIIGPVMVGPSSSHTAGAVNIGRVARQVFGCEPNRVDITLYGSFAKTHKGHGTDRALVGGVLEMATNDSRIKNALNIARQKGIMVNFIIEGDHPYHPNTAKIDIYSYGQHTQIIGISIGGGRISIKEIDGFEVDISGEYHAVICSYDERLGMVARISSILALEHINIAFMRVSRCENREKAIMVIESDQRITEGVLKRINDLKSISHVKHISKIEF